MEVSHTKLFIIAFFLLGNATFLLGNISISGYSVNDFLELSEERSFISKCNIQFGPPNCNSVTWVILPVDEYTSYSNALYIEHEFTHIGEFGPKGKLYYCDDINEWNALLTERTIA